MAGRDFFFFSCAEETKSERNRTGRADREGERERERRERARKGVRETFGRVPIELNE